MNASTIGSNTLIPAPGSGGSAINIGGPNVGSIFIWQILIGGTGANVLQFQSGSTNLGGPLELTGDGASWTLQYTGAPWMKTAPGQAFNLTLTTTATVNGTIYWTAE